MHQAGKRASQVLGSTSIAGPTHTCSRLFYPMTKIPDRHGCGSHCESTFEHTSKNPKGPSLQAINNTSIPTYGTCSLTLNLGLRRTFRWVFVIADVSKAIIGADFLKHYGLSVDMKSHRLLDPLTHLKVQGITSSVTSSLVLSLLPRQPKSDYQKILMDFPTITNPYNGNVLIKHDITHHIETRGPPVYAKP